MRARSGHNTPEVRERVCSVVPDRQQPRSCTKGNTRHNPPLSKRRPLVHPHDITCSLHQRSRRTARPPPWTHPARDLMTSKTRWECFGSTLLMREGCHPDVPSLTRIKRPKHWRALESPFLCQFQCAVTQAQLPQMNAFHHEAAASRGGRHGSQSPTTQAQHPSTDTEHRAQKQHARRHTTNLRRGPEFKDPSTEAPGLHIDP